MAKEITFTCLNDTYGGLLSPNDVRLFYYDICLEKENSISFSYVWDDKIESYLKDKKVTIESKKKSDLTNEFQTNKLYFDMLSSDEGNKAFAFFRHLRNSFMHYNIGGNETYFCMKDFEPQHNKQPAILTMIGKIEKIVLYDLMNLFFQQKEKCEKQYNNYLHPTI